MHGRGWQFTIIAARPRRSFGQYVRVHAIGHGPVERRQVLALIAPLALVPSTFLVFQAAVAGLGDRWGYFVGFLYFWIAWCLAVPIALSE